MPADKYRMNRYERKAYRQQIWAAFLRGAAPTAEWLSLDFYGRVGKLRSEDANR